MNTLIFIAVIISSIWSEGWFMGESGDQIVDRIFYAILGMFIWRLYNKWKSSIDYGKENP